MRGELTMEDTIMNVIEEVANNEENVVENVIVKGNGLKDGLIGAGVVVAAYAAFKGAKKLYAKIKAKKEHTEPVPVEVMDKDATDVEE
jgi:hypothetical protein